LSGDINIDAEWEKMDSAISIPHIKTFRLARYLQIAASIAVISLLTFLGLKVTSLKSEKAPLAALMVTRLPDGSSVTLNAGSKITYANDFGTSHRTLTLKGEAYFEVTKAVLPFIIDAGDAHVQVTGTRFNVKAYAQQKVIKVTVTEGTVRLCETGHQKQEATLFAGETGIFDRSLRTVNKTVGLNINDLAWKTMVMDFTGTPLAEVTDVLSNTYHVTFDLQPELLKCSVTVHFENRELESVLEVLKSTLDLKIIRKGRKISIKGTGC
jgi:ferric-dicitrate binding protein FerR (iron transport regulator)